LGVPFCRPPAPGRLLSGSFPVPLPVIPVREFCPVLRRIKEDREWSYTKVRFPRGAGPETASWRASSLGILPTVEDLYHMSFCACPSKRRTAILLVHRVER